MAKYSVRVNTSNNAFAVMILTATTKWTRRQSSLHPRPPMLALKSENRSTAEKNPEGNLKNVPVPYNISVCICYTFITRYCRWVEFQRHQSNYKFRHTGHYRFTVRNVKIAVVGTILNMYLPSTYLGTSLRCVKIFNRIIDFPAPKFRIFSKNFLRILIIKECHGQTMNSSPSKQSFLNFYNLNKSLNQRYAMQ